MRDAIVLLLAAAVSASCGVFVPSEKSLQADPHGHLVWAARTGDAAAIRRLAASGLDLDASAPTARLIVFPDLDHIRWTALQHAAHKRQLEAARALIEWGAAPDARQDGATPLYIAAAMGDRDMVQLLLDAGADIDTTAPGGTKADPEAEPGGPLWHFIEHTLHPVRSPKDVLEGR